jgi:hypothetical protein
MLVLLTAAFLVLALWIGAPGLGIGLLAAGLVVQLAQVARLVRASGGGVGGHAEWVREGSTRRRLRESPVWLLGCALAVAGAMLSFWQTH